MKSSYPPARFFLPRHITPHTLSSAVQRCRACRLCEIASQAVFGEGPAPARAALVGEQPGNEEDRQGRPFVGPAGAVLERTLRDVGIDRATVYVTNAVKHFSFVRRGKARIHKTPSTLEITACRPWLEAELELVRPEVLVCLGSTAARALLGPAVRIGRDRGRFFPSPWAPSTLVTYHPSALLRAPQGERRDELWATFRADLRLIARRLAKSA